MLINPALYKNRYSKCDCVGLHTRVPHAKFAYSLGDNLLLGNHRTILDRGAGSPAVLFWRLPASLQCKYRGRLSRCREYRLFAHLHLCVWLAFLFVRCCTLSTGSGECALFVWHRVFLHFGWALGILHFLVASDHHGSCLQEGQMIAPCIRVCDSAHPAQEKVVSYALCRNSRFRASSIRSDRRPAGAQEVEQRCSAGRKFESRQQQIRMRREL